MKVREPKPHNNRRIKQQRKRIPLLLTVIFIMIGVAYLIYWFLVLRHHQETDNAYISGNQVQIMSQVPGSVVSVHFENTDFVKSGDVLVTLDPTDAEQAFEQAKPHWRIVCAKPTSSLLTVNSIKRTLR